MRVHEKLDRLRKLGKVMVTHKRMVDSCYDGKNLFFYDDCGNLIKCPGLPKYMTVKEFNADSRFEESNAGVFFSSTGGYCEVRLDYKDQVYYGRADCDLSDAYNKRIGLSIAIGRLEKELFSDHPDLK